MKILFISIAIFLLVTTTKAEYEAVSFYVVAHQDDWQLFMGSNAYYDIINKNVKTVFIYTTSGCLGIIGNQGNGEGYGSCTNCTMPYFRTRELGAISSIQLLNPPSRVGDWCNCWPYPPMSEDTFFINGKNWYIKKYIYCNTVSYFLRIVDNSLKLLKNGTSQITSIENENDKQNTFRDWSDLTNLLNKIITKEKGLYNSFWLNTHETDLTLNPDDHDDHLYTGLACEDATKGLKVNFNYFVGYYSANLGSNLSPDASAIEGGLLAAYNKPKIDAGWYEDWEQSKKWCSSGYNRLVPDTSHSSIKLVDNDKKLYSLTCSPNPNSGNELFIRFNLPLTTNIRIELINTTGFVLSEILSERVLNFGEYSKEFDITGYPSGLYFVRLFSDNQIITADKFLKR